MKNTPHKMNVCFDASIFKHVHTGIYWTAYNLLLQFLQNDKLNVSLFTDENPNILNRVQGELSKRIKNMNIRNSQDDFSDVNAFFSPAFHIPEAIKKYPKISTYTVLYDTIPLIFPQYFGGMDWFSTLCNNLDKNAHYFSISDWTRKDFLTYFPNQIEEKNIETTLLAANETFRKCSQKDIQTAKKKYHIPDGKKYVFSLCTLEPRKNLIRAVKTFIEFIKKNKIDDMVFVLGGGHWDAFLSQIKKEIADLGAYRDKIIHAGYIADEDLAPLYSGAEWFVYTSQYEGFGLPPLEAMQCGTAVITSNNSSLPEVVGDAAQMIDWDNDEQHVNAYEKYYFDTAYRVEMAKKGLERSKLFSWQKCADKMVAKMMAVESKKAEQPLVTIITPSFNLLKAGRKETFIQNIESVKKQTYPNIEHIVIDGASTDGTLDFLREFADKGDITYYSEPDKGIYDALNKGILKSKGKYVVCLNSDDCYCDDHAVEWLVSKAEEFDADATYADCRVLNKNGAEIRYWNGFESIKVAYACGYPCHQTLLIKKDVMMELGLYDIQYKVSADNVFMTKMMQNGKRFEYVSKCIVCFREGGYSNDHLDVAWNDLIQGLYHEWGKFHSMSMYDAYNLQGEKYLMMPIDSALKLGAKLQKPEWIEEYYKRLFNHHLTAARAMSAASPLPVAGKKRYVVKLFCCLPVYSKKQRDMNVKYKILGLPIFSKKQKILKIKYKVLGIPVFKMKKSINGQKVKYYILGIPVLKIVRK